LNTPGIGKTGVGKRCNEMATPSYFGVAISKIHLIDEMLWAAMA
jgi:hypothetical protein